MKGDFQPRKNDSLVEPMFEALGGSSPDKAPAKRSMRWFPWVLGLAVLAWCLLEVLF